MSSRNNLALSLFFMRISVFLVMFIWALDKFIDPSHGSEVWKHFYFVKGLEINVIYIIGAVQMIIYFAYLFGVKKRISTGLVFLMHAGSTLLSFNVYLHPWSGHGSALLFFAAWPMLAAAYATYALRDSDTMFSLNIR